MKKITIIGLPGSGKSTFASKLSKHLKIPVHHLDTHMFLPGGKKREKQDFLEIKKNLIEEPSWIIEGCAISSLEMRFEKSDTVIYFHLPRLLCIWRAFKRLFRCDKSMNDTPQGCKKVFNLELVLYIWNFEKTKGPKIEQLRKKYPKVTFHEFKTNHSANDLIDV
ncbi:MAG: hypothetical protein SP1CHLAM54_04320 [Chlamydiia bacterium]|nr:hypothetical protein [Chlamydiia bacterium]MCH9615346.1 hypothetical protein [Chlamydiia bacterium]MCH9628332.1 hypothetical protein [Chlamydiia bacterium]